MKKHTPGPWLWDEKFQVCIPHETGTACFRTNPEDARLIVAAPELLKACKLALDYLQKSDAFRDGESYAALIKAIAKAEGNE